MSKWLDVAQKFAALAVEAQAAGNMVVMIVALQRAAECVQIAKRIEGTQNVQRRPDRVV